MQPTVYIPQIDVHLIFESIPYVLQGLPFTFFISLAGFTIGNLLAIALVLLSERSFWLVRQLIRLYISFLRGVPALVLLFILYFGLPIQLDAVVASVICFSMMSSAFLAEIYRGAISGVDKGQRDAAYALGLSYWPVMRKVILPQAFRTSIPALGNVAMDMLKGTSLVAMITVPDIFQRAKIIGGREFDFMSMYLLVAILYWLLCLAIGWVQKRLERRWMLPGSVKKKSTMSFFL